MARAVVVSERVTTAVELERGLARRIGDVQLFDDIHLGHRHK